MTSDATNNKEYFKEYQAKVKKISLFFIFENYIYFVHKLLCLLSEVISIYSEINFEKSLGKASSLT